VAGQKSQWLRDVGAYTAAGVVASAAVGAGLGWLGRLLVAEQVRGWWPLVALTVAMLALARELGWRGVPLPQPSRQTRDVWGKVFPEPLAAALWGFDLGLVFTTQLTFAGAWLLAVVATAAGSPTFGAALFVLYWLGRALSVWLMPRLLHDPSAVPDLLAEVSRQRRLFHGIHVVGLVWAVAVLIAWQSLGT
jgi:hypothetical protein